MMNVGVTVMLVEHGPVRVGLEIEVAAWKKQRRYQDVASELVKSGFMADVGWKRYHDYNCSCAQACKQVRSGNVFSPPRVTMQYDASLPDGGAEFISSPVLLTQGLEPLRDLWDIIVQDADWRLDLMDMRGRRNASPSVHMHVSAVSVDANARTLKERMTARENDQIETALLALSNVAPELMLLADTAQERRGIYFRQPWRWADGRNKHHGFIQVRRMAPNHIAYIEWRLFEAAYQNFEYIEAAAYVSAALTRAFLDPLFTPKLLNVGTAIPLDEMKIEQAIAADDLDSVLALADANRLDGLKGLIAAELHDDPYGRDLIERIFKEAERRV